LLYRSGDLTRWLENGEIEYLGRADAQVKVRGYRVEIPEIEAVLTSHAAIGESVVLAEAHGGTTQLVGFFTAPKQENLAELRRYLEEHLPNYMVPSRLVQLERIPVTPNGKVDRAALLSARAAVPAPRRSVSNAVEEQIAQAWSSVLGISSEQIGPDSSFFTVGGDSIGANLVVRLLANRGVPVELLDLFENPTLSGLANVILSKGRDTDPEAERMAYWSAVGSTVVAPPFGPGDANAGVPHRVTIQIPLGALPAGGESELRNILLTALGLSLRM
jgi:aryl carrier-like protein